MNSKPKFPVSLYGICALVGVTVGLISVTTILILLPSMVPGGGPTEIEHYFAIYLVTVISGAISGIVIGRIGYLIKPWKGVSIGGAALGGVLSPILLWAWSGGLSEYITERMYPKPKPIPTLSATFQELTSGDYMESCAVNLDGSRLALGAGTDITFWDLNEQTQISKFRAHYDKPLALSPDGRFLALDNITPHDLIIRDMQTGKQLKLLKLNEVNNLVFSPDGRLLAAAILGSGRINLLDPSTGKEVANIEVPGGPSPMAFSPDGKMLAVNDSDHQITIWDTTSLNRVGKLKVPGVIVKSLAFSPDGSRLVAGIEFREPGDYAFEMAIGSWDVDTGVRLAGTRASLASTRSPFVYHVAFSLDGQKLITSGDRAVEWKESISPDDLRALLETQELSGADLFLWDANSLEPLGSVSGPNAEQSEAYILPDGRVLACYWNEYPPDSIGIWTIESP